MIYQVNNRILMVPGSLMAKRGPWSRAQGCRAGPAGPPKVQYNKPRVIPLEACQISVFFCNWIQISEHL